jgi:hypothetical protein
LADAVSADDELYMYLIATHDLHLQSFALERALAQNAKVVLWG